ncbi:MAG: hypothetical protein GEU92_13270 [Alphaproteobacteria bacterium]|nr:hypothetical protein [Alphaproteobacteria bacterium]
MTEDFLEYPRLMERAVRGVVRQALSLTAEHGLPGLHHFYIAFRTRAEGVEIPSRLVAQYPDEMTIVLEHQYWDLQVDDAAFSVTLSFGGVNERLHVPFDAVTSFVDPSVKFGLQFQQADEGAAGEAAPGQPPDAAGAPGTPDEAGSKETVVALDRFRKK